VIFNGLKGAELIIFNYLAEADLSRPISANEISLATNYHPNTIQLILARLEDWELIRRSRQTNGQAYQFKLVDDERIAK
jgi:DNA-binding IclR family transcriptional regulator